MNQPVNIAIVGLGKMGISHLGIANATPALKVTAVCDSSSLLGQMIERYCKIPFVMRRWSKTRSSVVFMSSAKSR
jgi:predicted dehydrogenase